MKDTAIAVIDNYTAISPAHPVENAGKWLDSEAEAFVECYAAKSIGRDLALRVYTTRLLGQDPRLVLHGGGNTSVKTRMPDLLGEEVAVLCVKGSGWDMACIEPAGLPAVRLEPLDAYARGIRFPTKTWCESNAPLSLILPHPTLP
jgi:rhamnose utilization protein RhaD (predicted bifunctional aldolase and dehydrogenase)